MAKKKTQRADGRYQGKLLVGVTDGKPKYRYVYGKTQKEVNDKLAALRVELGAGVDLTQDRALSYWIDRWLRRTEQTQTPEWFCVCEARADLWRERLGRMDVTQITTADLEDVLLELANRNPKTKKPSAKKTLTEYRNVITRVFDYILQNRVITFNPASFLTVKKDAAKHTRTAISNDQIRLIRETPGEIRLACLIMVYAGLRLGELCALTWSDVDLLRRTISVNKSWNFKSHNVKTPKTAAGVRTVPIPDLLAQELETAPRTSLLVCPPRHSPWTTDQWRYAAERYSKSLGFKIEAHCLRHTYCTILYEAGVDVLSTKELMGHAEIQTTMQIYTHLREEKRESSAAKLNAFLTPVPASETAQK